MGELGIFRSYRLECLHGMCYIKGLNRINDYNTTMYNTAFKFCIDGDIIYVDKYINKHFEGTVLCANRFCFEEINC